MKTPLIDHDTTHEPATGRDDRAQSTIGAATGRRRRRSSAMLGVAAAAAVVAVGAAVIIGTLGGDGEPNVASAPLELSLGEGDAMASCLPFDVSVLSTMSPAFAATATSVDSESVTLSVDRWYTGGDAETVVLQTPNSSPALIAGFEFEAGRQYLITASDGNVNFCGYSGIATPEMTAAFESAFPG